MADGWKDEIATFYIYCGINWKILNFRSKKLKLGQILRD
jgi:hypothetical protein